MSKKKRITQVEYEITLSDGKNYAIRPLSLEEIKNSEELFSTIDELDDNADVKSVPGLMDKLINVCFTILARSDKSLTRSQVGYAVGMNDIKNIMGIAFSGEIPVGSDTEVV